MTSTPSEPSHIIHGAPIEGMTFCSLSENSIEETPALQQAKHHFNLSNALRSKLAAKKIQAEEMQSLWEQAVEEGFIAGIEEGRKQGYQAGKEEGFDLGLREGAEKTHKEFATTIKMANTIVSGLSIKRQEMFEQAKPEMIKFSLAICKKLLLRELKISQSFVNLLEALLTQAKANLKEAPVSIVLSPDDLEMIREEIGNISYDRQYFRNLDFVPDQSIPRGNCRIETPLGLINFDIDRLIDRLEERVMSNE